MPMTWNDQSHAKLLVAILHTTNAKLDYGAIAQYMGPECTIVAIRLHLQQLKRQVSEASGTAAPSEASSLPATPEKRKRGRKPGKEAAKGKDVNGEDTGEGKTQAKSPKKKAKSQIKSEDSEEEEEKACIKAEDQLV